MMKKIYLAGVVFLLIVHSLQLSAQGWEWRIPAAAPANLLKDVLNNVYAWSGNGSGTTITKYSPAGYVLWATTIARNVQVTGMRIRAFDNSLYIVGNFSSVISIFGS